MSIPNGLAMLYWFLQIPKLNTIGALLGTDGELISEWFRYLIFKKEQYKLICRSSCVTLCIALISKFQQIIIFLLISYCFSSALAKKISRSFIIIVCLIRELFATGLSASPHGFIRDCTGDLRVLPASGPGGKKFALVFTLALLMTGLFCQKVFNRWENTWENTLNLLVYINRRGLSVVVPDFSLEEEYLFGSLFVTVDSLQGLTEVAGNRCRHTIQAIHTYYIAVTIW